MAGSKKSSYAAFMDGLPFIIKLLFCIFWNLPWALYRIIKGIETKNVLLIVIGIFWAIAGIVTFIIDFICIIIFKKPVVFV